MDPFGPVFSGDEAARAALAALREAIQQRHGGAAQSLLFYGSCLRSGDLHDGLVDLWVIVDGYRGAHRGLLATAANRLLAPNVYYLQVQAAGRTVRCKYALFSAADIARGASRAWFESYVWGRLCQRVAVAWARDEAALAHARAVLRNSVRTFLERTLPVAPPEGSIAALWSQGLSLSYATELRSESGGRAADIVAQAGDHVPQATVAVAASLRWPLQLDAAGGYRCTVPAGARSRAALAWRLRRVQGKGLSVLRLLKALFTFEGGLDYIAWKLERHSGRPVQVPERVRRFPLLFVWGFMWRLHREGFFR